MKVVLSYFNMFEVANIRKPDYTFNCNLSIINVIFNNVLICLKSGIFISILLSFRCSKVAFNCRWFEWQFILLSYFPVWAASIPSLLSTVSLEFLIWMRFRKGREGKGRSALLEKLKESFMISLQNFKVQFIQCSENHLQGNINGTVSFSVIKH